MGMFNLSVSNCEFSTVCLERQTAGNVTMPRQSHLTLPQTHSRPGEMGHINFLSTSNKEHVQVVYIIYIHYMTLHLKHNGLYVESGQILNVSVQY